MKRFKSLDILIILTVVLLSFVSWLFLPKGGDTVTVYSYGKIIYQGSIKKDITIITPDKRNTITVENGNVFMSEADCPDKLCKKMGMAFANKPIACLPNELLIVITSEKSETDGITY